MQKKLIAVAIAGAMATPVAVADLAVSGSVRAGLKYTGSSKEWTVANNGSRLRFKASEDLGNGQSAYMNYEFGVDAAKGSIQTGTTKRLAYVGIKGDWGSMSIGAQWSTMFNVVGTYMDPSNTYGGSNYGGGYRMSNSVHFSTDMGPMAIQADAQMSSGGDDLDKATIGTTMSLGDVQVGAAWQDNGDNDITGVGGNMSLAGVSVNAGYLDINNTSTAYSVNGKLMGVTVGYDEIDTSDDAVIWGNYKIDLGGGANFRIEISNDGTDTSGIGFLRFDF